MHGSCRCRALLLQAGRRWLSRGPQCGRLRDGGIGDGRLMMETVEALVRTLKLYLVIGLVASAVNAVGFHAPPGDTHVERAAVVVQDIVLWPRFLADVAGAFDGRLAMLPREDQP